MNRILLTLVVIAACGVSFAQKKPVSKSQVPAARSVASSSHTTESEAAKTADIRKLLQLTGSREMVNQMKSTLMEQFRQSSPNLPPEMFQEMLAEMKAEDLEESIIPIYLKNFSANDIKHLIAFYESPFGRKVTKVMPVIMQESSEVGMNWGQGVVTRVATKWRKDGKLTEHEYEQLVGPEEHPN